jgi:DNA mismatch repair ATPase MutL
VLTGSLDKYIIQSSVTTEKVILSPVLYNNQKGMVVSRMNITLQAVRSAAGSVQSVSNPRKVDDLVYEYNPVFAGSHEALEFNGHNTEAYEENANDNESSGNRSDRDNKNDNRDSRQHNDDNKRQDRDNNSRFRRSIQDHSDNKRAGDKNSKNQHQQKNQQDRKNKNRKNKENDSSSSYTSTASSSNKKNHQPKPTMSQPPQIPMLPYFVGYNGQTIDHASQVQSVSAVKRLAQQIGNDLQNPSQIPQRDTLAKYTLIARLVRIMNVKQLEQVTSGLYVQHSSSDKSRLVAWKAFRDAVATAGTSPALLIIKEWIMSRKVQNEEAAELIAVLPNTARLPTPQYMKAFFVSLDFGYYCVIFIFKILCPRIWLQSRMLRPSCS